MENLQEFLHEGLRRQLEGDYQAAEAIYRQILSMDPHQPDALSRLATLLATAFRQPQEALELLERAVAAAPEVPEYHFNLATVLKMLRRYPEAETAARKTVALAPGEPGPLMVLGSVLLAAHKLDETEEAVRRALQIDPDFVDALAVLMSVHTERNRPLDAVAVADRALAIQPNNAMIRWNRALAALTAGDFHSGWPDFEWRLGVFSHLRREFTEPTWQGQNLADKTILLHCEGGFGDAIHFVRYLPEVIRRAAGVLLECPQPLFDLFKDLPGLDKVLIRGQPLPRFDIHCPLQSIPLNLNTTLETIPADVPYLHADPQKVERFNGELNRVAGGALKVGLVWTGSETPSDRRSRTLSTFAPLADVANVQFFGLQVGPTAIEAATPPAGMKLHDLSPELRDFSDLAGALENLDLLISIDTSVAHLAGALARPVWTLIPIVPDFRWMLNREDSPWYPTMRLFRQTDRANWDAPLARMAQAMRERVGKR